MKLQRTVGALYISGPMSGIEDHNFPAFNDAADMLRRAGYEVINPAEKGLIEGWAWEDYLRWDLREVLDVEGLAMLPGWTASPGANLEVHVAKTLGIPVRPFEHWLAEARNSARVMTPESE